MGRGELHKHGKFGKARLTTHKKKGRNCLGVTAGRGKKAQKDGATNGPGVKSGVLTRSPT